MSANIFKSSYNIDHIKGAWELIKSANNVTLLTHTNADGDGVSACAALDHVLQRLGKNTETIYPDKPEFNYKYQASNCLIANHHQKPELLIACDVSNYERLYWPAEFKNVPLINIDHHVSNSLKGKFNFVNADSSSACEEVYIVLQHWDESLIDKYVAQALLFGILYDSQIFHIQPLRPRTLNMAADLMEKGAELFELEKELLSNKNHNILIFWGKILSGIQISSNGKAAWACVTKKDLAQNGLTLTSLVGFNNILWQICDVDVTILFYEREDGKIRVSLRSKKTDVNEFAKQFGGGGHKNAAGILSDKPLENIVKEITSKL